MNSRPAYRERRGLTLIELIITAVVLLVLTTGLLSIFTAVNGAQRTAGTVPQLQSQAEQLANEVGRAIRKSTLATSADTTCTLNAGVESTSATAITVYGGANGSITKTTYANSGGNVTKATNGGTASTLFSNASIAFIYYEDSGGGTGYHLSSGNGLKSYTPTTSTTPNLVAVKVTTTMNSPAVGLLGALTVTYSTIIRLRNGPLRSQPTD